MTIQIGEFRQNHLCYLAEISDGCIIRVDFLRKHGGIIDLRRNVLQIGNSSIKLNGPTTQHQFVLKLSDDEVLPPNSEILLSTFSGFITNSDAIVEPIAVGRLSEGVLLARIVVSFDKPYIPIRLINATQESIQLKKGTPLCEAQCLENVITLCEKVVNLPSITPSWDDLVQRASDGLSDHQRTSAVELLEDFKSVFSQHSGDFGRTHLAQHKIDVGDAKPIKQSPRKLPYAKREEANKLLKDMQKHDVIEASNSPWASPVVLVRKKDGSIRFCVDYRRLNDVTKKDSYPLPAIDLTVEALSGASWFSTVDMQSGYWQVEMTPEDKDKTAFTMGAGLWQFKVLSFGLCNAPATFQRLAEKVLHNLSWETCLVYMDDVIIHGKSFEDHRSKLKLVLEIFKLANLKLNPKKCNLFRRKVKFLGFVVAEDGVRMCDEKVSVIRDWPTPRTETDVRAFLGLCSYYRMFVKGFATITKPLTQLLERDHDFYWDSSCEISMSCLKEKMTSAPILAYPDVNQGYILDSDASNTGIGAVLSQIQDGTERVIENFSKSLSRPERNYCVTRRELLAIVKALKHFHHYVYGREIIVRTDHAALRWLTNFKQPEGQLARWLERLQQNNITIVHRPGLLHGNADGLSRRPCSTGCSHCKKLDEKEEKVYRIAASDFAPDLNIQDKQTEDPVLCKVKQWLVKGVRPDWTDLSMWDTDLKAYWAQFNTLILKDGILFRKWLSADGTERHQQLVIPRSLRKDVLQQFHSSPTGGVTKTLAKIKSRFYWVSCSRDVRLWVGVCETFNSRKGSNTRERGNLQIYNVGAQFERIALDILGPLPMTTAGNKYVLVISDYFTKWPEAAALPDQTAETVSNALIDTVISRFGVPLEIHSDQARNSESNIFQQVLKTLGLKKTRTTALHPQSDGMVERFNRTALDYLAKSVDSDHKNWDKLLPILLLSYRSAVHETTKKTPALMIMGRELRLPGDLMFKRPSAADDNTTASNYVEQLIKNLHITHELARENLQQSTDYHRNCNLIGLPHLKFWRL